MLLIIVRIIISLLFGWIVSGIINYIADVLPQNRQLINPTCSHCGKSFSLKRYLLFSPCEDCDDKFPIRHGISLFVLVIFCIYIALSRTMWVTFTLDLLISAYVLLLIIIDIEHHLILHITSAFGAILTVGAGIFRHGFLSTIYGAVAGLVTMLILYLIGIYFGKYLSKKRGEEVEEGLGFGDVILGAICGLLLGWPGISAGLFSGIVLGGFYSLGLVVIHLVKKQYQPFMAIPYGPFLAGAAYLFWIFR
jgi:prepilin signal peptidase PulO-like enzyme (type II secretory pathway)